MYNKNIAEFQKNGKRIFNFLKIYMLLAFCLFIKTAAPIPVNYQYPKDQEKNERALSKEILNMSDESDQLIWDLKEQTELKLEEEPTVYKFYDENVVRMISDMKLLKMRDDFSDKAELRIFGLFRLFNSAYYTLLIDGLSESERTCPKFWDKKYVLSEISFARIFIREYMPRLIDDYEVVYLYKIDPRNKVFSDNYKTLLQQIAGSIKTNNPQVAEKELAALYVQWEKVVASVCETFDPSLARKEVARKLSEIERGAWLMTQMHNYRDNKIKNNIIWNSLLLSFVTILTSVLIAFRKRRFLTDMEKRFIRQFLALRHRMFSQKEYKLTNEEKKFIKELEPNIGKQQIQQTIGHELVYKRLGIIRANYNEFYTNILSEVRHGDAYERLKKLNPAMYDGTNYTSVLLSKIAAKHNINPKNIFFCAGASEGFEKIINAYGKDKKILIEVPTYGVLYNTSKARAKELVPVKAIDAGDHSKRDLLSLKKRILAEQPDLVIMCNPGNPLSTHTPVATLIAWLTGVNSSIKSLGQKKYPVFLIDEAYMDFVEAAESTNNNYSLSPKNVIFLRTFSKMYGLADKRIGYYFASSAEHLKPLKPSEFTDIRSKEFSLTAVHALDSSVEYIEKVVTPYNRDNEQIITQYKNEYLSQNVFYESFSNMLTLKLGWLTENQKANLEILKNILIVKYGIILNFLGAHAEEESSKVGLEDDDYIRITLGGHKNNDRIFWALKLALAEFTKYIQ